jgi:hypothetical protein
VHTCHWMVGWSWNKWRPIKMKWKLKITEYSKPCCRNVRKDRALHF